MLKYLLFVATTLLSFSCIEDYALEDGNFIPHFVVEGLITNKMGSDSSYVRLTYSVSGLIEGSDQDFSEKVTPVNDATVIVNDDLGHIDTLLPAPEYITYLDSENIPVTYFNEDYYQKGYYYLNHLNPEPGHMYYLRIINNSQEYSSQCFMPALPVVDSVSFQYTQGETGKSDYYVPRLYFRDTPGVKNYYLFNTANSMAEVWYYSILSDEFFNGEYVNGLDVFQGQTNIYWLNGYFKGGPYYITMQSLTSEAYNYYTVLMNQFKTDGGTYKPTPASPVSNISNGALGFFRASSTTVFKGMLPYQK